MLLFCLYLANHLFKSMILCPPIVNLSDFLPHGVFESFIFLNYLIDGILEVGNFLHLLLISSTIIL